ncbi:MAG: hypothetical protein J6Z11_12220, partial [Candidatus Riflebacteria bacterium]|nr:hypothetical protein [Candidatus Riflebacteria bacterium]
HILGFHPSYEAYNNPIVWKQEKDTLEKTLNIEVEFGREHYLRFEAPFTWQIWEDSNMLWDSTLNYADHEGFRCGTCWEYHVFNFLTKQELQLVEKPLIVMEGNFFTYQKELKIDTVRNKIVYLINKCKKYNGTFVYLWHNTSLLTNDRKELYIKTLLL